MSLLMKAKFEVVSVEEEESTILEQHVSQNVTDKNTNILMLNY